MDSLSIFLMEIPFRENAFIANLILWIFFISVGINILNNILRIKFYKTNSKDLFFEEYVEGISYKFIPSILMSIGIIGTFYLIYMSLSNFQISKIEEVSNIITHQIAPAFSMSALGIFMSILYLLIEKMISVIYKIRIKRVIPKKSYTNMNFRQNEIFEEILKAINLQTKTFSELGEFSSGLADMSESMSKFGAISESLEKTLNPEVLGEVISNAFLKEMSPVLNRIEEVSKSVDKNSEKITEFLEVELKNEIMIPLKNSVDNTSEAMKEIKIALNHTSEAMVETNKGFDKLNESLNKLETLQEDFVKNLDDVLDKQTNQFEETTTKIIQTYELLTNSVKTQIDEFNDNSKTITNAFAGLSDEMKEFLVNYKNDYKELLQNQEQAIKDTTNSSIQILQQSGEVVSNMITSTSNQLENTLNGVDEAIFKTTHSIETMLKETTNNSIDILKQSGFEVSNVITSASNQLQNTLSGVDEALIKTSQSIKEELEKFKDSYTDSLKGFLNSQEEILNKVFKDQTERLANVVNNFKVVLEDDVNNRKILNEDLDKLIKTTNGFVAGTKDMITTAFDEQQNKLMEFINTNEIMQNKLNNIISNTASINEEGNKLTNELIDVIKNLYKQFNDNQTEVLKKYQISVEEHLKDILNYMAAIIEASHIKSE